MSDAPAVSVVIPCHDAAGLLSLQLAALAGQEEAPDFEVVVVDNRSTDDLAEVVRRWAVSLPGVRLVRAERLPGAGYARNVGIGAAQGERLLFCDADDVVARDWVREGAAALEQVEVANGDDVTLPYAEFRSLHNVWDQHLDVIPRGALERAAAPVPYPILLGGNFAARRETLLQVGGFDAGMVDANEDNDLAVRLQRHGHLLHRAHAMLHAARRRASSRGAFDRALRAGRGHVELSVRHGMREQSPHLSRPTWRLDPLRATGAAAKVATRPREERDWPAVATRLGAGLGLWLGEIDRVRGRRHEPAVGVGIEEGRS